MIEGAKKKEVEEAKQEAEYQEMQYSSRTFGAAAEFGLKTFGAPSPPPVVASFGGPPGGLPFVGSPPLARCAASRSVATRKSRSVSSAPRGIAKGARKPPTPKSSAATAPLSEIDTCASDMKNVQIDSNINTVQSTHQYSSPTQKKDAIDFTKIPKTLDSVFEQFSNDEAYGGVLRTSKLNVGDTWEKASQPNLLSKKQTRNVQPPQQRSEKNKAFDLLDALSRSGSLPISAGELHIIITTTHCFEKSVVETVVRDNVNPLEKIERSHLVVASVIHDVSVGDMLRDRRDLNRIVQHSPSLSEFQFDHVNE